MPTPRCRTEFVGADKTQLYYQKRLNVKSPDSEEKGITWKTGPGRPTRSLPSLTLSSPDNQNLWKNRHNQQSFSIPRDPNSAARGPLSSAIHCPDTISGELENVGFQLLNRDGRSPLPNKRGLAPSRCAEWRSSSTDARGLTALLGKALPTANRSTRGQFWDSSTASVRET
jgi:hypothetical protein